MNTQPLRHRIHLPIVAALIVSSAAAIAATKSFVPPLPVLNSFAINGGDSQTPGREVTLNNTASDYPASYMASEDPGFAGGTWLPYDTAPRFTLSAGNGPKTVYMKLMNETGESNVLSDSIALVEPPVLTAFAIDGGDDSTSTRGVTLNNTCTNAPTEYMASEDLDFAGASWLPYSASPGVELSSGNGLKTVYFKTRNAGGESNTLSDTITLVEPPELTSFLINGGDATTTSIDVALDNVCSRAPTEYMASENASFAGAVWADYLTSPVFTLSVGDGPKTVYFKARNAGGESNTLSDTIDLVKLPEVLSLAINGGAATTASPSVTLNNTCTNEPAEFQASEDSGFSGAAWTPYDTAPAFELTPGNGVKTVYFRTRNASGESDTVSDSIELAQPPAVEAFSINGGDATTAAFTVVLDNACTHAPSEYIASESPTFAGATWQAYDTAPAFTLSSGNGPKTVYFRVRNAYGESGDVSDAITVSAPLPEILSLGINMGAATTPSREVTLDTTCTGSPTEMIASENASFAGAAWDAYDAAAAFQLSSGNESKTVYVKVRNNAGESSVANDSIVLDVPPPAPVLSSMIINDGAATTAGRGVTLDNVCTGAPTEYMASEDAGFAGAAWSSYDSAPGFELSAGNGVKQVYFKARNAGGESNVVSDTIQLAAPRPLVLMFRINDGASDTESRDVVLNLSCSGSPTHMMASEDGSFSGAIWQPYFDASPFTLSAVEGLKTVYVKVKTENADSDPASDSIEYAVPRPPEVLSILINDGDDETNDPIVLVRTQCSGKPTECQLSEDPSFAGASWRTYIPAMTFTLSPGNEEKMVYFRGRNPMGETAIVSDSILLNVLGVPAVISFHINNGAIHADQDAATLMNLCTNAPTHYMASESPDFVGATWQTYALAPPFTLSPGLGLKRVYFKVKNDIGESYVVDDTIVRVDPSTPSILSLTINEGAASTDSTGVTLNNSCEYVPTHYMASEDPEFTDAEWLPYDPAPWFILSASPGEKTVYFRVMNDHGYSGSASDTIFLSEAGPVVEAFAINADALSTGDAHVTLNNSCIHEPTEYMASEDAGFAGAVWYPYDAEPLFMLSPAPGLKTVYFKVRNSSGESNVAEDAIDYDPVLPAVMSFSINGGDEETSEAVVTLESVCAGAPLQCMASESPGFVGAAWEEFAPSTNFTLSPGVGIKQVYFKVRNAAGESEVASDTIALVGCEPPPPTGVQATDWVGGRIRIVWLPVPGDDIEYRVYRGGAPLSGWLTKPVFDDFQHDSGCGTPINRTYTVVAKNACGMSAQSAADSGDDLVSTGVTASGLIVQGGDVPSFAVRWNHDAAIADTLAVTAKIGTTPVTGSGRWFSTPLTGFDWIVFTPDAPLGLEGSLTVSGTAVEQYYANQYTHTVQYTFDLADTATYADDPSVVELEEGVVAPIDPDGSAIYEILPHALFEEPITVQLPVPDTLDAATLDIWYFGEAAHEMSWCPNDTLRGWLVPGSRRVVMIGGQEYLEFQVNHAGIVQLAAPLTKHLSARTGFFGALLLIVYVFGGKHSPMRRTRKRTEC